MKVRKLKLGFTLVEMLLVVAIVGMLLYMAINYFQQQALQTRIDKTSVQLQQILNAGMSYYVNNGNWPDPGNSNSLDCLQGNKPGGGSASACKAVYIPQNFVNPWAASFNTALSSDCSGANPLSCTLFYAYTLIEAGDISGAAANAVAGKLPMAYITSTQPNGNNPPPNDGASCIKPAKSCYVVTSVNIPGQNLNNATAVNFSGIYHPGGCVPVPSCPTNMVPQITVVPISVSGNNDKSSGKTATVYPISSFTAYAQGGPNAGITPDNCVSDGGPSGGSGGNNNNGDTCQATDNKQIDSGGNYWRACMQVVSQQGDVSSTNNKWAENTAVMAITRCAIPNQDAGSDFSVYEGD